MRAFALAIVVLLLSACGHAEPIRPLGSTAVKFSVEQFRGPTDPGAWRVDATDNEIAANRREATSAISGWERLAKTLCYALAANGQVVGRCEDLPE